MDMGRRSNSTAIEPSRGLVIAKIKKGAIGQ